MFFTFLSSHSRNILYIHAMSLIWSRCFGNCAHTLDSPSLLLTHWGRVMHICLSNLTIIGSDNGLSPGRRQAITWTSVGILLIGPLGTNFSEMSIKIHTFLLKRIHLKMSSGKWRPFCLGLNMLTHNAGSIRCLSCIQKSLGMVSTKPYNSFWIYTIFKWYQTGNFPLIPLHQYDNLLVRFGHLSWVSVIPEMRFGHPATKRELRLPRRNFTSSSDHVPSLTPQVL